MIVLFFVLGFIGWLFIAPIWKGFVLSVLWGWFIVPFFGLPELSITYAIGISLIFGMVSGSYKPTKTKTEKEALEDLGKTVTYSFLMPAFALLVGWIVTLFM